MFYDSKRISLELVWIIFGTQKQLFFSSAENVVSILHLGGYCHLGLPWGDSS